MKGIELISILQRNPIAWSKFGGLYSVDELNCLQPIQGKFYICNTDRIFNKGKHWIVIFWDYKTDNMEYFDSLGKIPNFDFVSFMRKSKRKIIYNNRRVQPVKSDACGYFCLYYIFLRIKDFSYEEILDNFSNNLINNEVRVKKDINQSFD